MTAPTNRAAYLTHEQAYPLSVREAPFPALEPNQVIIKTAAIAVNPVDYVIQDQSIPFPAPYYPWIPGHDVAGTVTHTTHPAYPAGTRVLGLALAFDSKDAGAAGFQAYVKLSPPFIARLPDGVSFEEACVLPLATATACAGLFEEANLGLQYPSAAAAAAREAGARAEGEGEGEGERGVVVVWGAASSVGSSAVQLCANAGYDVFATAGAGNAAYAKERLGAAWVFDYKKEGVVKEVLEALKGRRFAGVFDAISLGGAIEACVNIAGRAECEGAKRCVATVRGLPEELEGGLSELGVRTNRIWGSMAMHSPVGKAVFEDFLPGALADGRFVPAPRPEVVGEGLENVQKAVDILKAGVSAKKLVVTL
ncbi:putative alcohol dehydrogenase [Macrophomina phaseolina]|uniref:Alcohol dehydrogenase n=1 Tax=Macrophomina phaseolina TaxID=35725 RepID=A0ABQ8FUB3_9PEZI|nr:putative alcohol dehydrogenase [Macrophomina phaseolina]